MSDTKTTRRDAARAVGLFLGTTQVGDAFKAGPRRVEHCRRGDAGDRTSGPHIVHRCCDGYDEGSTFYSF